MIARNSGEFALGVLLLMLSACAAAPKSTPMPPPAPPPAPVLDASFDWHGLLLLPFGSVLKDAPFTLHEVLMFRDAAHAVQSEDAECYAMDRTAPRFMARTPSQYLLCFRHDHLTRVEATVNLPQEEAAQVFSDACALWQRNAGAVQTQAGHPGAAPPAAGAAASGEAAGAQAGANAAPASASAAASGACEGRDGPIDYSARLEEIADRTDTALTIRLDAPAQP